MLYDFHSFDLKFLEIKNKRYVDSGWMKTTSKEHGVYLPEAAGTNLSRMFLQSPFIEREFPN